MPRTVTVKPGVGTLVLPDGNAYTAGDVVSLTDDEYARLTTGALTLLTSGSRVVDPGLDADFVSETENAGWYKIGEQTLGAAAPSIDFTTIPQTFRALKLHASLRGDQASNFVGGIINVNGDLTDANYITQRLQGNAAAAAAAETLSTTNADQPLLLPAGTATASHWGTVEVTIFDYANATKFKVLQIANYGSWLATTGGVLVRHSALIRKDAAALDRITLTAAGGNWIAGSVASLWGVKAPF